MRIISKVHLASWTVCVYLPQIANVPTNIQKLPVSYLATDALTCVYLNLSIDFVCNCTTSKIHVVFCLNTQYSWAYIVRFVVRCCLIPTPAV